MSTVCLGDLRRSLVACSLIVLTPRSAQAQATPYVPPTARVYGDVSRLAALGLIDTILVGPRPYTEREVVRLLKEARRNLDRRPTAREWAASIIQADLGRWDRGDPGIRRPRPIDAAQLEVAVLKSPSRPAPSDPNGSIDATINPLADDRQGRPLADDGLTETVESYHSAVLGRHLALTLNPRATLLGAGSRTSAEPAVALQSGSANVLLGNLAITAGRDYMLYGEAPTGGLLFSEQAPALDLVRVANNRPAPLPGLFKYVGALRGTLSLADLGPDVVHPHSALVAYHVAALPVPRYVEFGLEVIDAMGGEGGQPAPLGKRVIDALPFIPAILKSSNKYQFSNKMAGGDGIIRIPAWGGLEGYGEAILDDFDPRRWRSSFFEDGGYVFGASFSCLLDCGRTELRAEYHQTGIRYYTHPDYPITRNASLLGDPLGPRGLGAYATLDHETSGGSDLSLQGAFEVRSGNQYAAVSVQPDQSDFHFVQVLHRPGEKRVRLIATFSPTARGDRVSVTASAGIERVHSFNFVFGDTRTNVLARVAVVLRPPS